MAPADWTDREREAIEFGWSVWELGGSARRKAVTSAALKCGDIIHDPEGWYANQWPQRIGRYARQSTPPRTSAPILLAFPLHD